MATVNVVLGSFAFAVFWVLAVFPAVPFLPIGRTAGSLLGAMLMVIFKVITPDQAFDAIDLPILGLLFGTMVVSIYLERADMFKYLGMILSWKSLGPKDLLCRICLVSAISSAFFTNDTTCVVLTEFVLKIARQNNVPAHPFLLALASSANIGSAATPIGNPQNLVIAIQGSIPFGKFLLGVLPAMLVGVVVNVVILLCMFWKLLSIEKNTEDVLAKVSDEENVISHQFSPAILSHPISSDPHELTTSLDGVITVELMSVELGHKNNLKTPSCLSENDLQRISRDKEELTKPVALKEASDIKGESNLNARRVSENGTGSLDDSMNTSKDTFSVVILEEKEGRLTRWKRVSFKTCVYFVTIAMLFSFLVGLNMSWTAITAALALVVLDFKDAKPCLEKVSYSLLIFFCGMFITVDGFNKTGIPSKVWNYMEPHSRIDHASGIAVLSLVILVLSNFASNVPTVLLLGAQIAASAAAISPTEETKSWLILAWVSTVAGNLSLLGSAANLIVCEQARRAQSGYTLTFWTHLKFGVPSTLIVIAIGLPLIRG
ncbi:hypothetical protein ACHQM5_011524 [Ranunculus cassubicifolius]